ncbi:growth hormone receptor [Pelodytes ibericus]
MLCPDAIRLIKQLVFLKARFSVSEEQFHATSGKPSITECRSPELETFTCYWTYGNLTSPSLVKLQYMKKNDFNWSDCPDNVSAGENSCYFNRTYTAVWETYGLQLISEDEVYDTRYFSVDDIVIPDPPVSLNWTILSVSATLLLMDIEITWEPPPSADIKSGWIILQYQVHYKEVTSTTWKVMDLVFNPRLPLYALKIDKEHSVKVRAGQRAGKLFGEFSEVLHIPAYTLPEPEFPWLLFVVIGLCALLVILMFIVFFKKERLKILILPPVPVPKIKGIDPDLLQKGKLDELNSILANHDSYKQELSMDDPWVEFIELDLDDPDYKIEGSDTDRLLGEDHLKSHSCLGVKDDDSGRASCCEPDIPETDFSNSDTCDGTSDTGQPQNTKENEADLLCLNETPSIESPTSVQLPNTGDPKANPEGKKWPLLVTGNEPTAMPPLIQIKGKSGIDFYALVSDITPAGRLLLSPGQRMKAENEECHEQAIPPAIPHPPNLNADNAYVCESAVTAFCAVNLPLPRERETSTQSSFKDDSYFTTESLNVDAIHFCPADETSSCSAAKASSYEMPVPDYTSVQVTNSPQSLVLNTTVLPDKECVMPCGYMSTDQVNKVMP